MKKQFFLPECLYSVDAEMSYEKLCIFHEHNISITGKVIRLDSEKELFEVDIGNKFIANMPFEDSTIYPIHREDGSLSPAIYTLVGMTIQAKIQILEYNNIVLSRRANMLEALETIKYETDIELAAVTGFSNLSVFLDIGSGITGRSFGRALANTKFYNAKEDLGYRIHDIIPVKITEFLEDSMNFELSIVATLQHPTNVLNKHDVVTCRVFDPVGDEEGIGYYVLINDNLPGIIDSPNCELEYGQEVVGVVKKVTKKGAKLLLVEEN